MNENLTKIYGRSKMTLRTWDVRILPQATCKDYLKNKNESC